MSEVEHQEPLKGRYVKIDDNKDWKPFPPPFANGGITWKLLNCYPTG